MLLTLLTVTAAAVLLTGGCSARRDSATPKRDTAQGSSAEATTASTPATIATITVGYGALLERDIVPQLEKAFALSEGDVKEVLSSVDSELISEKTTGFRRMEGMVPPGSYSVSEGSSLEELVQRWVEQSEQRYSDVTAGVAEPNDLSASERLTLASIVEAECLNGEHQDEVAATFLNRLRDHQRLQSCVTAEYANGFQRPFLLNKDVAKESPYNTYYASGLPKGPISAVSDASLAAATRRSTDADVYYFFYDYLRGQIYFFSDYATFRKAAAASRERFDRSSPAGAHDKIDKQKLYGSGVRG